MYLQSDLCRICLKTVGELIFIFRDRNETNISQKLIVCLSLTILEDDKLPQKICLNCLGKLEDFYEFRRLAIKSQESLSKKDEEIKLSKLEMHMAVEETNKVADDSETSAVAPRTNSIETNPEENTCTPTVDDTKYDQDVKDEETVNKLSKDQRPSLGVLSCEYCKKEHRLSREKRRCEKIYGSGKKKFAYNHCDYETSVKSHLRSHPLRHSNLSDSPYKCLTCGQCFRKASDLQDHENFHLDLRLYECQLCNMKFHFSRQLYVHIDKQHLGEKAQLETMKQMSLHKSKIQISANQKSFLCDHCGRNYASAKLLRRHVKTHSTEKDFKCSLCDKKFRENYDLKVHFRTHSQEKPYQCQESHKNFAQKFTLTAHMNIHTRAHLYTCEKCARSFTRIFNLKIHEKTCK